MSVHATEAVIPPKTEVFLLDMVKVYEMVSSLLCEVHIMNEQSNEVVIINRNGTKKWLKYFESETSVGLKDAFEKVIIQRPK
jgi:hypothetical protein